MDLSEKAENRNLMDKNGNLLNEQIRYDEKNEKFHHVPADMTKKLDFFTI